ncbi:MAG: TetR/AcrR family transcriptional regulator [Sulfitobacter sp.]
MVNSNSAVILDRSVKSSNHDFMSDTNSSQQRGSRELWLEAAYELLIAGGIDAVKVMTIARHLKMSRTGFYWFFDDLTELHRALLSRWKSRNTSVLIARCECEAFTINEALFTLMECWLHPALFDAQLDLAVRNWARVNPELQEEVEHADATRMRAVEKLFERFGYDHDQAEVRAMTVIYTQIGYISMMVHEEMPQRIQRVQHYVEVFSGIVPKPHETEYFEKRIAGMHRQTASEKSVAHNLCRETIQPQLARKVS